MSQLLDSTHRPGLLVSVRNSSEALTALSGGAQIIDVKEPTHGSLGAASADVIRDVVRVVEGRVPVTAAAGELIDLIRSPRSPMPSGVALFKIGLAGSRAMPDWKSRWKDSMAALWPDESAAKHAVAVVYADWQSADAPHPNDVLDAAVEFDCPALLIDTWDKSAGSLFDHWPMTSLVEFLNEVKSHGLMRVLAGSLINDSFATAALLRPDLLAVRGAACDAGRNGAVSRDRVSALRDAIANANARLSHS